MFTFYDEGDLEMLELTMTNAVKAPAGVSLKEILAIYTMDKLKVIAGDQDIANRSKMKKGELVEAIAQVLVDPEVLSQKLLLLDDSEYAFFQNCQKGELFEDKPIYVELYSNLCRWGYLYLILNEGHLYYDMPKEIKDTFAQLNQAQLEEQRQEVLLKWHYMEGLANFYGLVTFEQVVQCYNDQNTDQTSVEECQDIFKKFMTKPQSIDFYQDHLVNGFLLEDDEFELFYESQEGKPAFMPSKEQILLYADDCYFEMTPQLRVLRDFMLENFSDDEDLIDSFIDDVQLIVVMEKEFQELIDLFEGYEFKFASREQVDHISVLLTDIMNNTRLWSNKGYTQLELHAITGEGVFQVPTIEMQKPQPIRVEKIGRNDPCPCGSGKKYKKCCGQ